MIVKRITKRKGRAQAWKRRFIIFRLSVEIEGETGTHNIYFQDMLTRWSSTRNKRLYQILPHEAFEPVVRGRDDLWFIVPMFVAFIVFAAWRLAQ